MELRSHAGCQPGPIQWPIEHTNHLLTQGDVLGFKFLTVIKFWDKCDAHGVLAPLGTAHVLSSEIEVLMASTVALTHPLLVMAQHSTPLIDFFCNLAPAKTHF